MKTIVVLPGEGIVDFKQVFADLHERGYRGPFTLDFGGPDERAAGRDRFAAVHTRSSFDALANRHRVAPSTDGKLTGAMALWRRRT